MSLPAQLRRLAVAFGLAPGVVDSGVCLCGHLTVLHEHDRDGSDCSRCGKQMCDRRRPVLVSDSHLPYIVEMAWRHAANGRVVARDMTVVDLHRRGGIELLIRVAAARVYDQTDPAARDELLEGVGWPAWFIAARALGEHRQLRRQLHRFDAGDQRALGIELLRCAARQGVNR